MGRSSNTQPDHSTTSFEPYVRPARRRARSRANAKQRDSLVKPLTSTPATNNPISTHYPSPLVNSLSEEYYDAQEELTPGEEEQEIYYDAYEGPIEHHKPVLANIQQAMSEPEPEFDGAAKGNINRARNARNTTASAPTPALSTAPPMAGFSFSFGSRGSTKPTVTPPAGPATATLAAEAALRAVPQPLFPSRESVKRALAVGINYTATMNKDKRLYYAVRDAKLWQSTFISKGVPSDNIKIITDDGTSEAPTCEVLLKYIRWLVQDMRAGDSLFFVFSGHSMLTKDGPAIVACDGMLFPRQVLEQELVMRVPKGVDLQVVFDCCHSAGMISLQYCVGRMAKPTLPTRPAEESSTCPTESEPLESDQLTDATPPRQSPYSHAPQHGSLYGIPAAADATPQQPPVTPVPPPVTPAMIGQETFGGPPQRHPRGGVVAAPPMAAANTAGNRLGPAAGVVNYVASLVGYGSTPAPPSVPTQTESPAPTEPTAAVPTARVPAAPGPRRARQGVVEGDRMPDYFEERKDGFVRPAGKVMVWAGTGEYQQAFEAYGGAKQGIVTKAMCAAIAACVDRVGSRRELWSYLVQEIETENSSRRERDASKGFAPFIPRVQHAELWVSQVDPLVPLSSAAPVLDQPML